MKNFLMHILEDIANQVQEMDALELGLPALRERLLEAEARAIDRLRERGIRVRKKRRSPREFLFPAGQGIARIRVRRYLVKIGGKHIALLDLLVNPAWEHKRGPAVSRGAVQNLGNLASDTRSYRRLGRVTGLSNARAWRLARRVSSLVSSPKKTTRPSPPSLGPIHLFLDGFYLPIREGRTSGSQKMEFKMAVIRSEGITRLYTSLDAWREKLSFNDGLFGFLMELFPDLGRVQGLVVGDGAGWIKCFRDDYLFHFGFQLDLFHLAREVNLLGLSGVYERVKSSDTRLDEVISEIRKALQKTKSETKRERLLNLMAFISRSWNYLRSFLTLPPELAVKGSGTVEGYIARAKDRLGRRTWSTQGLMDFWALLKTAEGWA